MGRKRWSFSVGPHGARVRVAERKWGGPVYLYSWDSQLGGSQMRSLGFRVRDSEGKLLPEGVKEAKDAASRLSNLLIRGESPRREATIRELFDLFRREELARMKGKHRHETRRALDLWEHFLGPRFTVSRFGPREWNSFQRERGSGQVDARGNILRDPDRHRPTGPRTVAKDLKVLRQACLFGTRYRRLDGRFFLSADPTRGLELPSESQPARPAADRDLLERLLDVADQVQMGRGRRRRAPLRELLLLAAYTGRRREALVSLRWSDWNPSAGQYGAIRWRAEADKLGRETTIPVHPEVRRTLEEWRQQSPGVGEAWIFPAPESEGHVRGDLAYRWLRRAFEEAELLWPARFGFHGFRRQWATEHKHLPAQDVAYAGGWKDTRTLQEVYQQPDPETLSEVVLGGRDLRGVLQTGVSSWPDSGADSDAPAREGTPAR